jgi:salicylate hydroxylase
MDGLKVIVVGGGIGGLTAALALLKSGQHVDVYEAAPAWADIGAGVTMAPNAMHGFAYLGLADAIVAAGVEPNRQTIRDGKSGEVLVTLERGNSTREKYGVPYAYIHRADLHTILVAEFARLGGVMHLNTAIVDVSQDASGATVTTADGSTAKADLVIGADGLKSVVRKLYEPSKAYFTGHIAFRAVAPVNDALRDLAENPGIHIGAGRLVVRYPMRQGALLNLVFFVRQPGWSEEGWAISAQKSELLGLFDGWCDDVQTMIDQAPEPTLFKWAINARTPLSTWSIGEHITLLGDSAHAMTPFLGQGAATAIEDGVVLSRVLKDSSTLGEALARYEAARVERTSFIQLESNANADRLQGQDTNLYGMGELRNEETLGLFDYNCTTVPV